MSYTYLLEQGGESSAECFSDIDAYALSKSNRIAEESSCSGSETESWNHFQYGMTSEPLTRNRGVEWLTPCVEGFHARTLAAQDSRPESTESKADSGARWQEWFARYDLDTYSWKTPQCSLLEGLDEYSETWPRWGTMRDGVCWELAMPDSFTIANASGFWLPTPSGTSNHGKNHVAGRLDEWGGSANPWRKTEIGKVHCPLFEEWMMGMPEGWTAPMPLETHKFQEWLRSHGAP